MDVRLELAGEAVALLPERAAYWPARKTLIVADLHWGKSEALQRGGVPLPSGALAEDLARLGQAIDRTGAERLLALGDLVHAASGLTGGVTAEVAQWRAQRPRLKFVLLPGNHDRRIAFPEAWALEPIPEGCSEAPFSFHHAPPAQPAPGQMSWAGHVHPCVVLRGGRDRLRLPCFVTGPRGVVLPAFGGLTGAHEVRPGPGERLYAVAGDEVVPV
jgi:DNA ligase-associated metallophosphoesterase